MEFLTLVAATAAEPEKAGLFEALGIDWKLLIVQTIAFLVLVAILGKFVYPALIRSIDARREAIETGLAEAKKSQEASEETEKRIEGLLADARKEADEIIARSQAESAGAVADAEAKAKQRAEQIIADARGQLEADVVKARAALRKDSLQLVAAATEKVIHSKLDADKDAELVETAIADATNAKKTPKTGGSRA